VRSETRRKLDLSYSQYIPRAFLFAWLITGREPLAVRLAVRGWRRSIGSMQDLRGPDVAEERVLRTVLSGAVRANLRRRGEAGDDLEGAWLRLPPRTRAALVLLYFDEIDPRHVADVLECSDATLASLRSRGLNYLRPHLGEGEESRLRSWLTERAESAPAPPSESVPLRRSVNRRRLMTVGGTALLAVLLAAGAVAGTRVALDRAENPPSEADREEAAGVDPELRNRVDDLRRGCPEPKRLGPVPKKGAKGAAGVAVQFNRALVLDDRRVVRALSEPSAEPTYGEWASTGTDKGVVVTSVGRISADDLFSIACGRQVTRHSLRVVMHDRKGTTSEGLAFFYLAHTNDGWRVWAADEPGA
jgi:DNA-directed RNA polymerase specialized sigma24 family protein